MVYLRHVAVFVCVCVRFPFKGAHLGVHPRVRHSNGLNQVCGAAATERMLCLPDCTVASSLFARSSS